MAVLGIETSCDETGVGVVSEDGALLANVVASQIEVHARYGGIVPEISSREHILTIESVVEKALSEARLTLADISAVAVTHGPGLAGSLLVGVVTAKALAMANDVPLIGVNHVKGHIAAALLKGAEGGYAPADWDKLAPPVACLVVSGGHTEIIIWDKAADFKIASRTRDDAAGEAFDKVARLLSLKYPGGPEIQRAAERSTGVTDVRLPKKLLQHSDDFSFSGLKTAVAAEVKRHSELGELSQAAVSDIAAEFQSIVTGALTEKVVRISRQMGCSAVVLSGGVAANLNLRERLINDSPLPVFIPPINLCTDNGAMIAMMGALQYAWRDFSELDLDVTPNLPVGELLTDLSAPT